MFNFTGRQIEVQGRNIQERTTIYTKLETVGQVLSFCLIQDEFFSNDYELVQMLGSISATDGHACMLRAMCEVSKLLSSHTGAILRRKSSLIVWQFHIKLEQFWPKLTVFHDDACLQASAAPFHSDGLLGDALNLLLSASHALVGEETEEEVGSYRDYTDAQAEGMVRRISIFINARISLYHVVPYFWHIESKSADDQWPLYFRSLETAHRTGACVQFPFSTSYQMGSIPSEFSTKQKKRSLIVSSLASWKHKFSLAHLELRDLLSECFSIKETWGPALYWLPKILVVRPSSSF